MVYYIILYGMQMCLERLLQQGHMPYLAPSLGRILRISQASSQYSLLSHPISDGQSHVSDHHTDTS